MKIDIRDVKKQISPLDNRYKLIHKYRKRTYPNWWKDYSTPNSELLIQTLSTLIEQLDLHKDAPWIRLPKELFSQPDTTISFLDKLGKNQNLFDVINPIYEEALLAQDKEERDMLLGNLEGINFLPKDRELIRQELEKYIVVDIYFPSRLSAKVKEFLSKVKRYYSSPYKMTNSLAEPVLITPQAECWIVNEHKHSGIYKALPDIEIHFEGGQFGGFNELVKGYAVSAEKLKKTIAEHLRGRKKMPGEINLHKWKYDLMKRRKDVSPYFVIKTNHSTYHLFQIKR